MRLITFIGNESIIYLCYSHYLLFRFTQDNVKRFHWPVSVPPSGRSLWRAPP